MLFFDSMGPNPKVVRVFMAERGISGIPTETVDLRGGENRREPFLSKNPSGQCPALALDNGQVIAEITAICEYLDEIGPAGTTLIGKTAEERAETRMWARRIDLHILEPMANGFRYDEGLKMFENRIHCIPAAAADLKATAQEELTWLDGLIGGRSFICGERLTLADILLFVFLDFFAGIKQPLNENNKNILAWYGRMKARPSATA
ncbi:MAG: glutathione S-transferase [Acetobacteraceae bacterium]|nr:glutathione S-transferase [Acetobacteraceae bacterium]